MRLLGSGGFGEVYLCRWHSCEVAVSGCAWLSTCARPLVLWVVPRGCAHVCVCVAAAPCVCKPCTPVPSSQQQARVCLALLCIMVITAGQLRPHAAPTNRSSA
jgi:hypothetical protein